MAVPIPRVQLPGGYFPTGTAHVAVPVHRVQMPGGYSPTGTAHVAVPVPSVQMPGGYSPTGTAHVAVPVPSVQVPGSCSPAGTAPSISCMALLAIYWCLVVLNCLLGVLPSSPRLLYQKLWGLSFSLDLDHLTGRTPHLSVRGKAQLTPLLLLP